MGGICVGAAVFLLCAAGWTLLAGRVIGPAIIGKTPVFQLQGTARTLTYLLFAGIAASGLMSGVAVAWRARAQRGRRADAVIHAGLGPLVAVSLLVAVSYLAHWPIEPRSTALNAVLATLGAVTAAAALLALPRASYSGPVPPARVPGFTGLTAMCVVVTANLLSPTAPQRAPAPPPATTPSAWIAASTGTPVPPDQNDIDLGDCALSAQETKISVGFTLFSVDAARAWTFAQKTVRRDTSSKPPQPVDPRDPAHLWLDTVDIGLKAGLKLTIGEHLLTHVLGARGGEGLSISGGSDAALNYTGTYSGLLHGQADDVIRWGLNRYGLSALGLPGLTQLVLPTLDSQPVVQAVTPPTSSEVTLVGTVTLEFAAGAGISYKANVEVAGNVAVKLEDENNKNASYVTNPDKVEFSLGLSSEASGSVQGPIVGLSGRLSGDSVLSIEFAKTAVGGLAVTHPTSVQLESTYKLSSGADIQFAEQKIATDTAATVTASAADAAKKAAVAASEKSLLQKILKALSATDASEQGFSLELTGLVKVDAHPDVLVAAGAVINAAQQASKKTASAADQARYHTDIDNLAQLIDKYAVIRAKVYAVTVGTAGIDLEAGDGLAFGASVEREHTAETLLVGFYRDQNHKIHPSTTCTP